MKHDLTPTPALNVTVSGVQLLTKDDLHQFKEDLPRSIYAMLQAGAYKGPKKWLKSHEVIKLLGISPGTLHTLRSKGTIPATKIGNIMFYDIEEIHRLLNSSTTKQPWEQK
jgi:Helix-turn-helix domain